MNPISFEVHYIPMPQNLLYLSCMDKTKAYLETTSSNYYIYGYDVTTYTVIIGEKNSCGKSILVILLLTHWHIATPCNFHLFTLCHCLRCLESWDFISRSHIVWKKSACTSTLIITFSRGWWVKCLTEQPAIVVLNDRNERVASTECHFFQRCRDNI